MALNIDTFVGHTSPNLPPPVTPPRPSFPGAAAASRLEPAQAADRAISPDTPVGPEGPPADASWTSRTLRHVGGLLVACVVWLAYPLIVAYQGIAAAALRRCGYGSPLS